jgi:hypothetical protein
VVVKITKVHPKKGVGYPIWGPQSQVWLYKMGTPNPPMSLFWGIKKTYNFENHEKPIEKQ